MDVPKEMRFISKVIAQSKGWTCECCGSNKHLDTYRLCTDAFIDEEGKPVMDFRNANLICLCGSCYRKYKKNAVDALRHITNPQVFECGEFDPRIEKYC